MSRYREPGLLDIGILFLKECLDLAKNEADLYKEITLQILDKIFIIIL